MKEILKKSGYISVITSLIIAILGIIIIINPDATLKFISTIFGISIIIIGILRFFSSFSTKTIDGTINFQNTILSIIVIILGIIVIFYSQTIQALIGITLGLFIIYSALIRFVFSIQIRTFETKIFLASLILSILMFICGIYLLFNANAIVISFGIIMVIYSVIDIIEQIIFIKYIDKL